MTELIGAKLLSNSRAETPPSFGGDTYVFEYEGTVIKVSTAWGLLSPGHLAVTRDGLVTIDMRGIKWLDEEAVRRAIEGGWI